MLLVVKKTGLLKSGPFLAVYRPGKISAAIAYSFIKNQVTATRPRAFSGKRMSMSEMPIP